MHAKQPKLKRTRSWNKAALQCHNFANGHDMFAFHVTFPQKSTPKNVTHQKLPSNINISVKSRCVTKIRFSFSAKKNKQNQCNTATFFLLLLCFWLQSWALLPHNSQSLHLQRPTRVPLSSNCSNPWKPHKCHTTLTLLGQESYNTNLTIHHWALTHHVRLPIFFYYVELVPEMGDLTIVYYYIIFILNFYNRSYPLDADKDTYCYTNANGTDICWNKAARNNATCSNVPGALNRLAIFLLNWFVGNLGVNYFVIGWTALGIVKLITSVCCALCCVGPVWSVVDLIFICISDIRDLKNNCWITNWV